MLKVGDRVVVTDATNMTGWNVGDTGVVRTLLDNLPEWEDYVGLEMDRDSQYGKHLAWNKQKVAKIEEHKQQPRVLPEDSAKRTEYPLWDGLFAYFPAALCEVARWSKKGNDQHNPGEPLHWAREKSQDHKNKILRHLLDAEQVDEDGFVEATALAWRSLALLQTILEKRGWAEGENAKWKRDNES